MKKCNSKVKFNVMIGIVAAILFVVIFGVRVLNPIYDDWLYTGFDLSQHYLGWRAFRQSSWHFPIGLMDGLNYPDQVSIIFTDSIPLFAVFFKILSPILPETFQYFGIWGMFSFVMTGVFSAKIFYPYSKSKIVVFFSVILVLLQPVMIWRMFYHTALAGQWILIVTLYLLFFKKENKWYYAIIIGLLASSIHIYFVLMCGILVLGYGINEWIKRRFKYFFIAITCFCLSSIMVIGILGGLGGGVAASQEGLREYGLNFLGFVNPSGYEISSSCILPDLPISTIWSDEGFAYVGLGGILLIVLELTLLVLYRKKVFKNDKIIGLMVSFAISFFIALSPRWGIGNKVILEIPLPHWIENIWSIFRATGRVAWILIYGLLILGIVICIVYLPQKVHIILLTVLLAVQVVDIHKVLVNRHNKWSEKYTYESKVFSEEELLDVVSDNIEHLYYISDCNSYEMYEWTKWALDNDITTNDFYFARSNKTQVENNLKKALDERNKTDMFVIKIEDQYLMNKYQMEYKKVGNYYVGVYED